MEGSRSAGPRSALTWRLVPALLGLVLFVALIWWISPAQLMLRIETIGWSGFSILIFLGGANHLVKTVAWRFTFRGIYRSLPLFRLFAVRLAGEAVSQVTVAGHLIGETTRAWLLRKAVPAAGSVSAVIADRAMFMISCLLVSLAGLVVLIVKLPQEVGPNPNFLLLVPVLIFPIVAWLTMLRKRWPFLTGGLDFLARFWPSLGKRRPVLEEIEENLFGLYHDDRLNFVRILGLNMVGQCFSIAEVFTVLHFLHVQGTILLALEVEAVTKVINLAGAIVPGNLGTSEAGNMLLFKALGLGSANGLAVALARRLRSWFWTVIGLGILYMRAFIFGSSSSRERGSPATDERD